MKQLGLVGGAGAGGVAGGGGVGGEDGDDGGGGWQKELRPVVGLKEIWDAHGRAKYTSSAHGSSSHTPVAWHRSTATSPYCIEAMHQPSLLWLLSVMYKLAKGTEYTSVWPVSRSLPTLSSSTHSPASAWSVTVPSVWPSEMDSSQVATVSDTCGGVKGAADGGVLGPQSSQSVPCGHR